jgi:cytoskeleton protein RodZ
VEEIGRRLRAAREAMGITVEQAEAETHIRRKYLEALESAREAEIPGEVYLKGFLRTYGNYVGLDGTELVEEFKLTRLQRNRPQETAVAQVAPEPERVLPAAAAAPPVAVPAAEPVVEPVSAPSRQAISARDRTADGTVRRPVRPAQARPSGSRGTHRSGGVLLVAVLLLAAIGGLGWLIFRQVGAGSPPKPPTLPPAQTTQPPAQTTQPPVQTTPPPVLPAPPKVTMTRGNGEDVIFTAPAKEVQVKLEFGPGRVWMKADVDGKTAFEGFPTGPLEFKGNEVKLRMGTMSGVSVIVNGQRFDKPLDNQTYNLIMKGQ